MYDGEHSKNSHYKALLHYYECLDDTFIFIVDDWNWQRVRDGTFDSFTQLNLSILYQKEIRLTQDDSHTPLPLAKESWHNGIYVAILKKNKVRKYSEIWFKPESFTVLNKFKNINNVKFLEIGSFEGYSTNYFIENFLNGDNSTITCIDPWIKYSESTITKMSQWDNVINENAYNIFINNTADNSNKIIIKRGLSIDILPTLDSSTYDFIYIDGDHSEKSVWIDAIFSFEKIKIGGIIIFDDYNWNVGDKSPKNAIDKFIIEYKEYINHIFINDQVIITKLNNK